MDALSIISERSEVCPPPYSAPCELTTGGGLPKKSTVHPLKPVYSSDQEHEERDPDTTLVESTLIPSSPMASKRSPGQLQHVCSSVDDFWTKIGEEQDDSPLDIKHLVLDLQDTGIRLFVSPPWSWPQSPHLSLLIMHSGCIVTDGRSS
jgi:hypothetical protein